MNKLIKIGLLSALLTLPVQAYAQTKVEAPQAASAMNCPMMSDMGSMQKDMGAMMKSMDDMMKNMADPAMKEKMQKMHDGMAGIMTRMQKMGSMDMKDMMKGGMVMNSGGNMGNAVAPAAAENHNAHHPEAK